MIILKISQSPQKYFRRPNSSIVLSQTFTPISNELKSEQRIAHDSVQLFVVQKTSIAPRKNELKSLRPSIFYSLTPMGKDRVCDFTKTAVRRSIQLIFDTPRWFAVKTELRIVNFYRHLMISFMRMGRNRMRLLRKLRHSQ